MPVAQRCSSTEPFRAAMAPLMLAPLHARQSWTAKANGLTAAMQARR